MTTHRDVLRLLHRLVDHLGAGGSEGNGTGSEGNFTKKIRFSVYCPDANNDRFKADKIKDISGMDMYGMKANGMGMFVNKSDQILHFTLEFDQTPSLKCLIFDNNTRLQNFTTASSDWDAFIADHPLGEEPDTNKVTLLDVGSNHITLRFNDTPSITINFTR